MRETYRQPLQILRNPGKGKFVEVSEQVGLKAVGMFSARGGAYADYDYDGDLDLVVSIMDARPLLLRNDAAPEGKSKWLRLKLEGTKSNRGGVGARVKLTAGGNTQFATVRAGEGYLSSNDSRLHFGLGRAGTADVEVVWPSGARTRHNGLAAGSEHRLRESPE